MDGVLFRSFGSRLESSLGVIYFKIGLALLSLDLLLGSFYFVSTTLMLLFFPA